jgi:hypothetical protein
MVTRSRLLAAVLGTLAALSSISGRSEGRAANDGESRCSALASIDFSDVVDAPTRIVEVKSVDQDGDLPNSCQVSGYVAPAIGFLLMLPTNWNGKLLQFGCGGFCGQAVPVSCAHPVSRGYACVTSDNGHRSTVLDALWAYTDLPAEVDHAYAGMHVTTLASKAIVERYYRRAAAKSYFMGLSTGGRLAMMAAQRFPLDFHGIVAGVPSLSVTGIHMNLLWGNRAFTDQAGRPLFKQIGDPRQCIFDPSELRCTPSARQQCLTEQQVVAARKIYAGATTSKGEPIYMPAALPGSEHTWLDWFSRMFTSDPHAVYKFVQEEFRYSAFRVDPGPAWKPEHFDFDRDYKRFGMADALIAAVNPDLRKFKAAGGKLIAFAGWNDAAGMPLHTVDYYETVERTMGGRAPTQDFFRLFTIPGMEHGLGEGAYAVDWLTYLEGWVESNRPPDRLIGFHLSTKGLDPASPGYVQARFRRAEFPLDPDTIEFARPIYPYPVMTRYLGRGDPRNAESFGPAAPSVASSSYSSSAR